MLDLQREGKIDIDLLEPIGGVTTMDNDLAQARARAAAEYAAAAGPVLKALAEAGFVLTTIAELYQTKQNYKSAIPILVDRLSSVSNECVKEDMVRALTNRAAKPIAARPLVSEFRSADPKGTLRWAIGNALAVVADDSVFDDVVELVRDRRFGTARQMLAVGLGNMNDSRAPSVLIELLDDAAVVGHAVMGLGKLKAPEARPALEAMKNHPMAWIRKEVAMALARISGN